MTAYTKKSQIKKLVAAMVTESTDGIFRVVHKLCATDSGDIAPDQHQRLKQLEADLTNLIVDQVWQNLPEEVQAAAEGKTLPRDMAQWKAYTVAEALLAGFVEADEIDADTVKIHGYRPFPTADTPFYFWIQEQADGTFYTIAGRESTSGYFEDCVDLLETLL